MALISKTIFGNTTIKKKLMIAKIVAKSQNKSAKATYYFTLFDNFFKKNIETDNTKKGT